MLDNTDEYQMTGALVYPQSQIMVLHDSSTGKLYLHLLKVSEFDHYDHRLSLVSTLRISEFTTYFCLYEEGVQERLLGSIIAAIGKASKLSFSRKKAYRNPFPKVLKRLARRLIRFYQTHSDGGFLTKIFHEKVYGMMKRIWRDTLAYVRAEHGRLKLRSKILSQIPQEAFLFEC